MKLNFVKSFFVTLVIISPLLAQDDVQIGSLKLDQRQLTSFFDFSDPSGINIKVQVWGYVKFPGYYVIPARSTVNELISLAGGPEEDALLNDVRILRTTPDSSNIMLKYDYNDLLWGDYLKEPIKFARMSAGDMLIIPGAPRYFLREDIGFYLSILAAVVSVAILAINLK